MLSVSQILIMCPIKKVAPYSYRKMVVFHFYLWCQKKATTDKNGREAVWLGEIRALQ